ncbi:hypothetical protein NDN08_002358 [Rhodosorus marinus]|uniref:Uncharacterized protein n=1 Tax=Rhodosorus marinus TaxID=101924 RepID=A0AAV8UTK8_9RHOD|nr:hypothetical protein NDN08_002358 [Rhodosorus marinus]
MSHVMVERSSDLAALVRPGSPDPARRKIHELKMEQLRIFQSASYYENAAKFDRSRSMFSNALPLVKEGILCDSAESLMSEAGTQSMDTWFSYAHGRHSSRISSFRSTSLRKGYSHRLKKTKYLVESLRSGNNERSAMDQVSPSDDDGDSLVSETDSEDSSPGE